MPSQVGLAGGDGAEVTVCLQRARLTRVGGLGGQEPSPASPASANGPSVPVTDPPHRGVSPFTMCLWSLSFTQISQPAEVEGETEAQRGRLTCSTSHSCSADLGPCRVAGEHRPRLPPWADHAGRSADTPGAFKQIQNASRPCGTEHRSEAGGSVCVPLLHPAPPSSPLPSPPPPAAPSLLCVRSYVLPLHLCPQLSPPARGA